MDKTIENENLQQEVARLTTENESLKCEKKELENSKQYWVDRSYEYENKYKALANQVKSLATLANGLVDAA